MPEEQETWVWSLGWEDPLEKEKANQNVEDTWVHESLEEESCSLARNIHAVLLNGLLFNDSVLSDSL